MKYLVVIEKGPAEEGPRGRVCLPPEKAIPTPAASASRATVGSFITR